MSKTFMNNHLVDIPKLFDSVPFVLAPVLVLTWHHVKIVTGRTIVGGARVVSGAEKKII